MVLILLAANTWIKIKKHLLKKALFLKQQFTENIKMTVKRIKIKNETHYFFNDMINIKNFDSNLLKIDEKIQFRWWFAIK